MNKEITVIYRDGSDVGLGVLDETGRKFHHIRFVKNAGRGGTELADKAVEIPIDDVEIIDGYDYDSLILFQDLNRATLEWRGRRQRAKNAAQIEAMEGVERKVATTMRKWDKENPEPSSTTPVYHAGDISIAQGPADPHLILEDGAAHAHGANFAEHSHIETYFHGMKHLGPIDETKICPVCEMQEPYHAVDCSNAAPEDEEELRCPLTTDAGQCDLSDNHDGPHQFSEWVDQEPLSNYQRAPESPTPEETQKTAPVSSEDVDVPF